jgi:hypothetical protein
MGFEQAVQNAKAFASLSLGPERTANIRVEEIESAVADGKPVWLITLSSPAPEPIRTVQSWSILGADAEREYKAFTVTKDTGEVLSMKIRLLATHGA